MSDVTETDGAFRAWRKRQGFSLKQVADLLDLANTTNPSRRVHRIETGDAPVDADMAEKIIVAAGGAVTLQDIHDTRLAFLVATSEAV